MTRLSLHCASMIHWLFTMERSNFPSVFQLKFSKVGEINSRVTLIVCKLEEVKCTKRYQYTSDPTMPLKIPSSASLTTILFQQLSWSLFSIWPSLWRPPHAPMLLLTSPHPLVQHAQCWCHAHQLSQPRPILGEGHAGYQQAQRAKRWCWYMCLAGFHRGRSGNLSCLSLF